MADQVDFHIYSLSFKEFMGLKHSIQNLEQLFERSFTPDHQTMQKLFAEFNNYLIHAGNLTAINNVARFNEIKKATLQTYSDWIRGDFQKRDKQESYLREILSAIVVRYNKQVSWHNITDAISIDSHKTVADYCELLSTMDALFIQPALLRDKLVGAPKKAKKLTFTDPFIYHAVTSWLKPTDNPYQTICENIANPIICADLVEAVVSNYYRRYYPTYYIKGQGEIDIAYIKDDKYWPIEVK